MNNLPLLPQGGPWCIEPNYFTSTFQPLYREALRSGEQFRKQLESRQAVTPKPSRASGGRIAVLNLTGIIEQHQSFLGYYLGGTSTTQFGALFDAAVRDASVETIVIPVDSPGGSSYGVQELSDKIYNARSVKPIIAIANSMAASAGYWIPSAASEFIATPGGDVGSIGVYAMHVDISKALDMAGEKITFISAGRYKVEGNFAEPLGTEAQAEIQRGVDETYREFVKGVARNRGVKYSKAREDFGQGRMFSAAAAKSVGLIDRVAAFDDVLQQLASGTGPGRRAVRGASQAELRARQEHRRRRIAEENRKLSHN